MITNRIAVPAKFSIQNPSLHLVREKLYNISIVHIMVNSGS